MKLLLDDKAFAGRIAIANGPLRPLSDSLAAELEPLLHREIYFPREKALLSRAGGRCPDDGELLFFDPYSPHEHRCPRCGRVFRGELHDRFWIYWYQLWLAERAVQAALLSTLRREQRFGGLASAILEGYAELYLSYPNVDNVLGPTRVFFSTYLESIWLLQICIAADILASSNPRLVDKVRDRIVEPSRALIAEYDEGASNRQVWNDTALLAAARLLDDDRGAERAVRGDSGVTYHLRNGLLVDGSWYEGENYHLFAHRGLWYGVAMAERAGIAIDAADVERFQLGFSTPFLTALPDLTLPSRRDSQYAISLRQWRIAEHCEVGLARRDDSALEAALSRLYDDSVPRRDSGRATSSADVERNAPPSALTRADLSWRALLFARPELPELTGAEPKSALLEGQGIAVFRRDHARDYVALDYGHSGGGHGHPDRLNLLLADGTTRWLDDYGTGSYVDRSLHWYRSTLAHNAPLVDGRSQRAVDGVLVAYDERNDAGWVKATADVAPGAHVTRTIVVMPDYVVDTVEWHADKGVTLDLPIHADLQIERGASDPTAKELTGGSGLEDGFDFVKETSVQRVAEGSIVVANAGSAEARLQLWAESSTAGEWWRGVAPGAPNSGDRAFRLIRVRSAAGRHRMVYDVGNRVRSVSFGENITVSLTGSLHEHTDLSERWQVKIQANDEQRALELDGRRPPRVDRRVEVDAPPRSSRELSIQISPHGVANYSGITHFFPAPEFELGRDQYRRSEQSWEEAGFPRATVAFRWEGDGLNLHIRVPRSERTFVPADAVNPYDNESPDLNGDSVQLYLRSGDEKSGWMLVPDQEMVRVRPLDGWRSPREIKASWSRRPGGGYVMDVKILGALPDALDLIVNERPVGRERRRGQLVLSGARGEFVYLRGDRHDLERLIPIRFIDE